MYVVRSLNSTCRHKYTRNKCLLVIGYLRLDSTTCEATPDMLRPKLLASYNSDRPSHSVGRKYHPDGVIITYGSLCYSV